MNTLFFSSGQKGGVGKSLVSFALIDYLTERKKHPVHLIESDTSNPDVGKAHEASPVTVTLNQLDDVEGWMSLLDTIEHNQLTNFVVNTAARSQSGFEQHYTLLLLPSLPNIVHSKKPVFPVAIRVPATFCLSSFRGERE